MRKTSGVSLMLLIFLSLCLIIFSLLSLSGAVADETLSSQAADRTTEYYAAVTAANDLLAQIDARLAAYLREAESSEGTPDSAKISPASAAKSDSNDAADAAGRQKTAYLQFCSGISGDIPDVVWEEGTENGAISFSVNVDDEQILQVRLDISYPTSDNDKLYHIHTWKVINTGAWDADNSMNLFRSKDLTETHESGT